MSVVGHSDVLQALTEQFPPVALLWGPSGVGKWAAAEQVVAQHKILPPDLMRVRSLSVGSAREISEFVSRAASGSAGRAVIVDLDGATPAAMDPLLFATEHPPEGVHILLVASRDVPRTLADRASVYRFGLLSQAEVTALLVDQRGLTLTYAERLAEQASGTVGGALEAMLGNDDRALVLSALRCLREGDLVGLESLADRWREEHTALIARWAQEAVSGQWERFNAAETGDVADLPLRVLMALRADVRPRLVVRALLTDVLMKGMSR